MYLSPLPCWRRQRFPGRRPTAGAETSPFGPAAGRLHDGEIDLRVSLSPFEGPVDLYLGLYCENVHPEVLMIGPDLSIRPLSDGLAAWKANVSGDIDASLYGAVPLNALPAGTYYLLALATPARSLSAYELWISQFDIIHAGDFEVIRAEPVQVAYTAHLIRNKATAFRAFVRSSFSYPREASFKLMLPAEEWGFVKKTGLISAGVPAGWSMTQNWGPILLKPGENEIMLPHVPPGEENEGVAFSGSVLRRPGIISGGCRGTICGPNVRFVPKPTAAVVSFSVEVDPNRAVPETDETNNHWYSAGLGTLPTKPWRFLFIPFRKAGESCEPNLARVREGARRQLEFLLATFPIAEEEITYSILPATTLTDCSGGPGTDCGSALVWDSSHTQLKQAADNSGIPYDMIVAIGCGCGGQGPAVDAVWIGECGGGDSVALAHEFNHVVSPIPDIYSLDCLVNWDETYCEHADGRREYCCKPGEPRRTMPQCSLDFFGEPLCTPGILQTCRRMCDDLADCQTTCSELCEDGAVFSGPDARNRHQPSEGFWVNRWLRIDGGVNYFMDTNWPLVPSFPFGWTKLDNTTYHCESVTYQDGYDALATLNPRFAD